METRRALVGYVPGAGDAIPESLREIGSDVKVLADQDMKAANLARFDAVVLGVRAYNVHPERMSAWYPELLAYAKQGGVVIVQYNTTPGPKPNELPHPLQVSRDRVTDETAEVRILAPDHPVLNFPNKITARGFRRLGPGTRSLFSRSMGRRLDADSLQQRSGRAAARRRSARHALRKRLVRLHRLLLVS